MLETAAFFERSPGALPLYEAFAEKVCAAFPDVNIKIQKTQITFTARYGFAFVSLPRSKKIGPAGSVVISLGLPREVRCRGYLRRWSPTLAAGPTICCCKARRRSTRN